ncbi:MAG: ATP synthase F1 subunit delta [Longicatena sp.]
MAGVIAKSYCEAIFTLAKENQKLDMYHEQLCIVRDTLKADDKYRVVMNHPKISKEQKKELLTSVYEENIDHMLLNFLKLLVDKGRFRDVEDITKEFMKCYNIENNIQVIYVESATELTKEEIARLQTTLENKLAKKVELVISVQSELMAGIRMKINDQMIDNSALQRLHNLKKHVAITKS